MNRLPRLLTALVALTLSSVLLSAAPAGAATSGTKCGASKIREVLPSGAVITSECREKIWSHNGHYVLILQEDGNLVFYRLTTAWDAGSANKVLWAWTGAGKGAYVRMDASTGALSYNKASRYPLRESAGRHIPRTWLKVQDDGKLVMYTAHRRTGAAVAVNQFCIVTNRSGRSYDFCPV